MNVIGLLAIDVLSGDSIGIAVVLITTMILAWPIFASQSHTLPYDRISHEQLIIIHSPLLGHQAQPLLSG